jgi:peptidoglycan/xylan/chitin deacetylase (PgdA/CDA1 family)
MSPAGRMARSVGRLFQTHYPGFVFGLPLGRNEIPVFTYHDVDRAQLSGDLDFLEHNRYRTLSLEEFLAASSGQMRPGRERSVLLTFDDARKSFWQVALPLLKERGARAVLFAPSYWMSDPGDRPASTDLFMSWEQLRECVNSGVVEVQSHAHRHALVFTDESLADFANPEALLRYDIYDWPMRGSNGTEQLGPPPLGTPIYRATPLLSAKRRYLESAELAMACRQWVASGGGPDFFAEPDWARRLRRFHRERAAKLRGGFMTYGELRRLVQSEFERSRAEFTSHLGYPPKYLAYPWMLGSRMSLELAREFGIQVAFGVALDFRAAKDRSLPIPVFGRLKCDWLRLLPGSGRANVLTLVGRKVFGFPQMQNLAH